MTKDEALRLALGALENIDRAMPFPVAKLAIKECKAALKTKDEPVACERCKQLEEQAYDLLGELKVANLKLSFRGKRTLIGLTDEEREQIINANTATGLWHMAKAIEAKLKEKNNPPKEKDIKD